jgi:TP901 family phage tail tape measure protein
MVNVLKAEAIITARDRTGRVFGDVARKIRGVDKAAAGMNRRVGMMERANVAVSRGAGAAVATAGRMLGPLAAGYGVTRAIKRFGDTEMALTRIGITAGATDAEIAKLQKSLRNLAYDAGKPFDEVTTGLEQLVAGGWDLPQAMPAMPAIARTAQAAGAETKDMANTALALGQNLGIASGKMQEAFDILVAGGKAGKFELREMARYLPSILPAAVAVGMKGEDGLKRVVGLLQAVRAGTGTTEEAAASVQNIFAKMESEQTVTRFKKFGIDLRKEMANARKEGQDLLQVFMGLTERATKGDLSKIPQLFSDMEFARGMRALLSFKDLLGDVMKQLDNAKGSAARDFDRVTKRSQISINRLAESWDRAVESIGRLTNAMGGSSLLQGLAKTIESTLDSIDRLRDPSLNPEHRKQTDQPQTWTEIQDRYHKAKKQERLTELEANVAVAEHDVAAAEATAKKRPGLGRDPVQARAKLERLRTQRDLLKLEIAASDIQLRAYNPATVANGRETIGPFLPYLGPLPPADPRGHRPSPALDIINGINPPASAAPVEATIKGSAEITNKVVIEPSPDFITRIIETVKNSITGVSVNGAPAGNVTGTTGSTGTSMPEASPGSP